MHKHQILHRRKIGQGQPRVIIFINFVQFVALMLQAKFQDLRTLGSEEDFLKVLAVYAHGGHLQVMLPRPFLQMSPLPKEAPHKI